MHIVSYSQDQRTKTKTGSPYYMAPELCANEEYGMKVDIWSLGVILFKMANMTYPVSNCLLFFLFTSRHDHCAACSLLDDGRFGL